MDAEFWHERWRENQIAFHEGETNIFLDEHFACLGLSSGDRIFVPLCGKAHDLVWLAEHGMQVVGVELDRSAVEQFFDENNLVPEIAEMNGFLRFSSPGLEIYVGDFFDLNAAILKNINAVYDRAALIALPEEMRVRYAVHLSAITNSVQQLLVSLDYDQSQTNGPPFSVPQDAISSLYDQQYDMVMIGDREISGRLAKRCRGREQAWHLTPKA